MHWTTNQNICKTAIVLDRKSPFDLSLISETVMFGKIILDSWTRVLNRSKVSVMRLEFAESRKIVSEGLLPGELVEASLGRTKSNPPMMKK